MIIDSHAYCFAAADSLLGYDSIAEHLAWVQAGQAEHYQPVFSTRDRRPGSSTALAPEGSDDHARLPDVGLRIDHAAGRVVWTIDGEDFTKHYYYHEAIPAIEEMVERIGADRLLWGTDMPFQNRHCTYRQSRDHIEKYCKFLGPEELELIMGGTAARILGLDTPGSA